MRQRKLAASSRGSKPSIDAPLDLRFAVFYGVSRNTWRIWDIDDAASAIGYEPVDDAEHFR